MNPDIWPTELDENNEAPVVMTLLGMDGRVAQHGAMMVQITADLKEKGWEIKGMQFPHVASTGKITVPCAAVDPNGNSAIITAFDGEWTDQDISHHEQWLNVVRSIPDFNQSRIIMVVKDGATPPSIANGFEVLTPEALSASPSPQAAPPILGSTGTTPTMPPPPPVPGAGMSPGAPASMGTPSGGSSKSVILSIISLSLSIVSLPLCFCCTIFSLPLSIGGAGLGFLALKEAKESSEDTTLPNIAMYTGIVLTLITVGFFILGLVMNLGFAMSNGL